MHRSNIQNNPSNGMKDGRNADLKRDHNPSRDDQITDITAAYQAASNFQSNNQDAISKTGSRIQSSDEFKAIEGQIKDFATSSKVLMGILDDLRKIHPVIDVVVLAFKAVVTLELQRRDNDQKVLILQVKMHDMMETFLQLQIITPDKKEPKRGFTVAESLTKLCDQISKDISSCGNLCDSYSKKRRLIKLLKSPIYEGRLSGYITSFIERRTELQTTLSMFTAHKIHAAISILENNEAVLQSISDSISLIFKQLRFQTPLEKRLWEVVEAKGGLDKCIADDSALSELLKLDMYGLEASGKETESGPDADTTPYSYRHHQKSYVPTPSYGIPPTTLKYPPPELYVPIPSYGTQPMTSRYNTSPPKPLMAYDSVPRFPSRPHRTPEYTPNFPYSYAHTPHSRSRPSAYDEDAEEPAASIPSSPPQHIIKELKEELQIAVDDDLKKNMQIFMRKLDVQRRQLLDIEAAVIRQSNRVISAVRQGPHDRVHDPELREIWKEMGWKLGVQVDEFVHTLLDYYEAQNSNSGIVDTYLGIAPRPGLSVEDQTLALKDAFSTAKRQAAEKWTLKHINMKNIGPLRELFDGDASGYVSVWEANQVASLRPKNWSFVQWLAYWAAGRHFTIWRYRQRIGAIILQMHKSIEKLLPTNRAVVDHYLFTLRIVDKIIWQITPCAEKPEGILAESIADYTRTEEAIMDQKLKALDYEIDAPDTLGLIIGKSQIERVRPSPLIYLLVGHHLRIIQAGFDTVFDREELSSAEETLRQIFDAVLVRVGDLFSLIESPFALFNGTMDTFAFGMVLLGYFQNQDPDLTLLDYAITESDLANTSDSLNSSLKLKYTSPIIPDFFPQNELQPTKLEDYITGVEGFWTGHLFDENNLAVHGMLEFQVVTWAFSDRSFQARGSYSQGLIFVDGTIDIHGQQGSLTAHIQNRPDYDKDEKFNVFLTGSLNIVRDPSARSSVTRSLPPQYTISGEWGYTSDQKVQGACYFSQTPAWVHYFKPMAIPADYSTGFSGDAWQMRQARVRSLWKFACYASLHEVYALKGLLRTETVRGMLQQLRKGTELARYQYLLSDKSPMNTTDQEMMNHLLLTSAPWNMRLARSVARTCFSWATLHYYSLCSTCSGVILGTRYYCWTCSLNLSPTGQPCDFCATCRHEHDDTELHCLLKLRRFYHERDAIIPERAQALYFRPSRYTMPLGTPPPPPTLSNDDSGPRHENDRLDPDDDSSQSSDRVKRVRFSMGPHQSPSASRDPWKRNNERQRSFPTSGVFADAHQQLLSTHWTTNDTTIIESGQPSLPDLMRQPCASCHNPIDLEVDIYWSCVICSDPSINKFTVVCSDCELGDCPVPPMKGVSFRRNRKGRVRPITGNEAMGKGDKPNTEEVHSLDHPLLRVYSGPPVFSPPPYIPMPWFPNQFSQISRTSKRQMAVKFIKGLFGNKLSSASDTQSPTIIIPESGTLDDHGLYRENVFVNTRNRDE
ncbi:hypothetical protein BDP27DRAFT_1342146 [Rhodocollybia butyracea]|uniref:Uncharacterized protein n=1 Tax=Rhodocollybia butyracea TaxID=206335 RepID=A0A9P5P873_9AGAR|nr:hypothetical protein BDP27DRAFT_1342146 [Rhodocollybia butyracea]